MTARRPPRAIAGTSRPTGASWPRPTPCWSTRGRPPVRRLSCARGPALAPIHWSFFDGDSGHFRSPAPARELDGLGGRGLDPARCAAIRACSGPSDPGAARRDDHAHPARLARGTHPPRDLPIPVVIAPAPTVGHSITGSVRLTSNPCSRTGRSLGHEPSERRRIRSTCCAAAQCGLHPHHLRDLYLPGPLRQRLCTAHMGRPERARDLAEIVLDGQDESASVLDLEPSDGFQTVPNPFPCPPAPGRRTRPKRASDPGDTGADPGGEEVWSFSGDLTPGFYHYHWPGSTDESDHLPPGAYCSSCISTGGSAQPGLRGEPLAATLAPPSPSRSRTFIGRSRA
jgi:hypothetical protein